MSRRLNRIGLLPALLLASEAWALGLGEIRLSSALNEPLRAEIQLLSASPDELTHLTVQLASADTFQRYGIDRPLFLSRLEFEIVESGRADGNVIRVRSTEPIREPFVTFLVEASWSRGRLLREYTLLLDPPTFAPPPVAQSPAVTAPTRTVPADSGRIERPAARTPAAPEPEPAPAARRPSAPPPQVDSAATFDTVAGGEYRVQRGDTLWGIAQRVRPDDRLTMNQVMLAIYEANPDAFAGNINRMSAGANLSIPSADDIYRIRRGDALNEVARHNAAWSGAPLAAQSQPSLTLVPPDGDEAGYDGGRGPGTGAAADAATQARIRELERTVAEQDSLIEIRDNELAALREELARLREEETPAADATEPGTFVDEAADELLDEPEEPLADTGVDDIQAEDTDEIMADDEAAAEDEEAAAEDADVAATTPEVPRVVRRVPDEPGIVDTIIGALTGMWGLIGGALVLVLGILVWFARRAATRGDEDSTGVWDALDADELDSESVASTERLRALAREDDSAIVVVEQGGRAQRDDEEAATLEIPQSRREARAQEEVEVGRNDTLEDTFSSETAINLDQSDPVAEADFHMAYGLYDQAADLINGALSVEPERQDLLAKLCEIYYVWGNRDAFIDAAMRMRRVAGDNDAEWGKIVIMGQQIAGDHEMFSGVSAGAATRAVDLSFEGAMDEESALDIDFAGGGPDGGVSDVIDLGAEDTDDTARSRSGIDFMFDEELDTGASTTREMPGRDGDETVDSPTIEMPDRTAESPTIEQQFDRLEATGELPSLAGDDATELAGLEDTDATSEIDLDDLGLDLKGLDDESLADELQSDLSDLDDTTESQTLRAGSFDDTGRNAALEDQDATGRNVALDEDDLEDTDIGEGVDTSLLDATGMTQVLSEDMAVETGTDVDIDLSDDDKSMMGGGYGDDDSLSDDAETLLASLDEDDESTVLGTDEGEFDFAKTEALPKDVFTGGNSLDSERKRGRAAGSTDLDLDLDDLTAALKLSGMGDTVDQRRDDATVEQPRRVRRDIDLDLGDSDDDTSPTEALSPEDFADDLHDARTMTEVGTKLDLARAYVDMGDPGGARSILEEVLDEGDAAQRQQAQKLLDSLPG